MIQFPETARTEWQIVADAAHAEEKIRQKIAHDNLVQNELAKMRQRHDAKVLLDQELSAEQTPGLTIVTGTDYMNSPNHAAPTDLIEGVLKNNGLCVLVGPAGTGKTTLALQMLHSLSTGADWLGQTAKPLSGGMGVLSYDQDASISLDWMSQSGIDMSRISLVDAYGKGNPLAVPALRQQIVTTWRAMNVEAIVLDSFSASFFGQNQNDTAETMNHYRDLRFFALTEVGAKALVVLTHSTAANPHKVRGSTVHNDVADSIIVMVKDDKTGERTVSIDKYRAGRGQTAMSPVVVTAPDSVTHLVGLDVGAMTLAGMSIPANAVGGVFPDLPPANEAPDVDSDEDEEGDDL